MHLSKRVLFSAFILFVILVVTNSQNDESSSVNGNDELPPRVYVNQIKYKSFPAYLDKKMYDFSQQVHDEGSKRLVMISAMASNEYTRRITGNLDGKDCVTKRRIVLDVNRCGLGNRINALFSTIILATLTNRVLEVVWDANKNCGATYNDLFSSKSQQKYEMKPFITDASTIPLESIRSEFTCMMRFDQAKWEHFYMFKDKILFDMMNKYCDTIFMNSNQMYAPLLFDKDVFGEDAIRLLKMFRVPYKQIASTAFIPRPEIYDQAKRFWVEKLKGKRWVAVHNRGFYDGEGKGVFGVFRCIDKMLANKMIDAVFFASESIRLTTIASEMAANRSLEFITFPKKHVNDMDRVKDSYNMRGATDMTLALVEWYLIGEGTYCMSNTIDMSTFSQTAIMRGSCHFIPVHAPVGGKMCDFDYPQVEKEKYLQLNGNIKSLSSSIDDNKRRELWTSIEKVPRLVNEQCFDPDGNLPLDSIIPYWSSAHGGEAFRI